GDVCEVRRPKPSASFHHVISRMLAVGGIPNPHTYRARAVFGPHRRREFRIPLQRLFPDLWAPESRRGSARDHTDYLTSRRRRQTGHREAIDAFRPENSALMCRTRTGLLASLSRQERRSLNKVCQALK